MKAVIIPESYWNTLPLRIVDAIMVTAKKSYGVKFISRETGEEYNEMAITRLFVPAIQRALNEANV